MILFGFVLAAFILVYVLVNVQPVALAGFLRSLWPILLIVSGALLSWIGRAGIGLPLLGFGLAAFARNRKVRQLKTPNGNNQTSSVRTAAFEMQLDHDTGDMNGVVLFGEYEGKMLADLSEEQLFSLFPLLAEDNESASLLEAYLDRHRTGWRENINGHTSAGETASSSSSPMSHEEAYNVLGLQTGAPVDEIRKSHRRLMKSLHPDRGGSTFLAAKINEAKDILLRGH